jgi:hypothetical protein
MELTIKYKKEKIKLSVNPSDSLASLIKRLSELTGVKEEHIKLLKSGVVMKDTKATLSDYSCTSTSKIMMLGEVVVEVVAPVSEPIDLQAKERGIQLENLDALQRELEGLQGRLKFLENGIRNFGMVHNSGEKLMRQSREIGELLTQLLLKVDGIQTTDDLVRARRKEVVKATQEKLDEADALKKELFNLLNKI